MPACDIEIYLTRGWQLADEPHCSGARLLPLIFFTGNSTLENHPEAAR